MPSLISHDCARSAKTKVIIGWVSVLTVSREDPGDRWGRKWDLSLMQNMRNGVLGDSSRERFTKIPDFAHLGRQTKQAAGTTANVFISSTSYSATQIHAESLLTALESNRNLPPGICARVPLQRKQSPPGQDGKTANECENFLFIFFKGDFSLAEGCSILPAEVTQQSNIRRQRGCQCRCSKVSGWKRHRWHTTWMRERGNTAAQQSQKRDANRLQRATTSPI